MEGRRRAKSKDEEEREVPFMVNPQKKTRAFLMQIIDELKCRTKKAEELCYLYGIQGHRRF